MKIQAEHIKRNLQDRTFLEAEQSRTKHTCIREHVHLGPVACQAEEFYIKTLRKEQFNTEFKNLQQIAPVSLEVSQLSLFLVLAQD